MPTLQIEPHATGVAHKEQELLEIHWTSITFVRPVKTMNSPKSFKQKSSQQKGQRHNQTLPLYTYLISLLRELYSAVASSVLPRRRPRVRLLNNI